MGKKKLSLEGQVFSYLTVIEEVAKPNIKTNGTYWLCRCSCGKTLIARGACLKYGKPQSCGCKKSEDAKLRMTEMRLSQSGTLEERFLSRFKKHNNTCWEWIAHKDKDGYGILPTNGNAVRAHRYSIEYYKGINPVGYVVCHSCDNPSCVNPDHLFIGRPVDNVADMIKKKRDRLIGSRNNKAKLNEKQALAIFNSKEPNHVLALQYGVSTSTIKRVKAKTLWRHIHANS